jgi:hypothetical protein
MSVCGSVSVMIGAPVVAGGEVCIAVDRHGVGMAGGRKGSVTGPGTGAEASAGVKASTANVQGLGGAEWSLNARNVEVARSDDGSMSVGRTLRTKGDLMGGGGPSASYGVAYSGYLFSWGEAFSKVFAFGWR